MNFKDNKTQFKQYRTFVAIPYETYETRQRLVSKIPHENGHSCKILFIYHFLYSDYQQQQHRTFDPAHAIMVLISPRKTYNGHSLEAPRRVASNEHQQHRLRGAI